MAKPKLKSDIVDERGSVSIGGEAGAQPTRTWANSHGQYIAARSHLDGVDALAADMERKWGVGRLRLLVSAELREKFDRQRYLLNQAIWHGRSVEDVRVQADRMTRAWQALDAAATQAGAEPVRPDLWEVALSDGTVAVLARSEADAGVVVASGRAVNVYTPTEIARLLEANSLVASVKRSFPGAAVVAARRPSDPLDAFTDSSRSLDEPLVEDAIPFARLHPFPDNGMPLTGVSFHG